MRKNNRYLLILALALIGIGLYTLSLIAASGTPNTLIVRTDANNYLLVTSVIQTNPVTQGIFSSRMLRTDSSGSLQVVLTGTVTPTYPMSIPASTCAAPSLGESGAATTGIAFTATPSILMCISGTARTTLTGTLYTIDNDTRINGGLGVNTSETTDGTIKSTISNVTSAFQLNGTDINTGGTLSNVAYLDQANLFTAIQTVTKLALVTTSTDGIVDQNTTAALVGTQVQISPRNRLSGKGWDVDDAVSRTVSFFTEVLPVAGNTVSGTWKLGFIDPVSSAITYPFQCTSAGTCTITAAATTNGLNVSGGVIQQNAFTVVDSGQNLLTPSTGNIAFGAFGSGRIRLAAPGAGQFNILDTNNSNGIGFDIATDGFLKLRDRAQTGGATFELLEQTAPAAGAANTARIYAVDDGSGKTKLCALFNTGAAQCFAVQP